MTTIVKLGGSLITEVEDGQEAAALERAAAIIGEQASDIVLVHGVGRVGHAQAQTLGLDAGTTTDIIKAFPAYEDVLELNREVVTALHAEAVQALPLHPLSCATRSHDGRLDIATGAVVRMVEAGILPVLHGGIVMQRDGAGIVGGDEIAARLGSVTDADRVGVCTDVAGVLDRDGTVLDHVDGPEAVPERPGTGPDVTGRMRGKVEHLVAADAETRIFGIDGLRSFLQGGRPGTRIGT